MATYKVKGQLNIVFEDLEIEAESEEEALNKLYRMDARDIVDDAYIEAADTQEEEAELSYAEFTVKTKSIDYDVDFNTCWDIVVSEHPGIDEDSEEFDELVYAKIDEIKKKLPQELVLTVTCDKEDLDDYVADAISEETSWLIDGAEYDIIKIA